MLWMDVCLQSTVEIASLLADTADYLLASPNISVSHNYAHALPALKTSSTAADLGKMLVSEYYHYYETTPYDADADTVSASGASMFTMSFLSLNGTNLSSLRSQIDSLADALLAIKNSDEDLFAKIYKTRFGLRRKLCNPYRYW